MSPREAWYLAGVGLPLLVLLLAFLALNRPMKRVLLDLFEQGNRARFIQRLLFAALVLITAAGALLPESLLDSRAASAGLHLQNSARQVLAAGVALLLGIGVMGAFLLHSILRYEERRRLSAGPEANSQP